MMHNNELRRLGFKVTAPRLRILEILEQAEGRHLSAEEIYRSLSGANEDVGLATVYRVLTQFEAAGLIKRHNFEEGHSVFEMNQGEHHDHLVCVKCGNIDEFVDEVIETRQKNVAEQRGFEITDHNLIIYGICKNCSL